MARSLQEYQTRWQQIMEHGNVAVIAEEEDLTNESCVIYEWAHSTPMGEGMMPLPSFGDAICYYRYFRVPNELTPRERTPLGEDMAEMLPGLAVLEQSWELRRPKLSDDELLARRDATEQALDALLNEFVQQGYQPEMSERLREIVNQELFDFQLDEVYVFPGDLDALLQAIGNPLADYDAYETEEEADAHAPAFDLNNPEHRAALKESIFMVGR